MLLVLNESSVRYYIDNSEKSQEEKRKAHENFGDLKRAFPLRKEKDEEVTRYKLAEGAKSHPGKSDVEKFEQVGKVFADGSTGFVDGPSIQQHPSLHRTMTQSACTDMGLSYDVEYTTKEYADDPDNPTVDLGVPDTISHWTNVDEGLESFIADVIHHVGQYYNPDPAWSYSYLCDHNSYHDESSAVGGIGGAPTATEYHFDKADNTSGETQEQWVGRLTHFPEDMGQPLHTGMAWQQANLDIKYNSTYGTYSVDIDPMYWLHYGYEDYVNDYWDADYWDADYYAFHENFDSNNCSSNYCYYETYGDGARLVGNLADFSHQYSETVYKTILDENGERDPSNWYGSTHDTLRGPTQDCMNQTGLWVRGCLDRYFG